MPGLRTSLIALAFVGGCAADSDELGGWSSTGAELESGTTSVGNDVSTGEPEPDVPPSSFLASPDLGEHHECETWLQNCPPGYKCSGYAPFGRAKDDARCVPISEYPDAIGEPCTVEGDPSQGIDSCVTGATCSNVDLNTNVGTCVGYCLGDPANLLCEQPGTRCGGNRFLPECRELCCPNEQDCGPGYGCYWDHAFVCLPWGGVDGGAYGTRCEFLNVCEPGLFCANPQTTLDCEPGAPGCCQPFCRIGSDDCDAYNPELECLAWYEDGEAPPGYELTGFCTVAE